MFKENDKVTTSPICSQQPCKTTFDICKLQFDNILEANAPKILEAIFNFKTLYISIFERVDENAENYFPKTTFPSEEHESHKVYIIRFIIDQFVNIKCKQIAKQKSKNLKTNMKRNSMRKLLHNSGV